MAIERIQLRRDTSARWTSANPILANGEPALETDTRKTKIGDGVSSWDALPYHDNGGGGGGGEGAVSSVAGRIGAVVLTADDLGDATPVGKSVVRASTTAAAKLAVGLSNVDNTSDNLKPISNATQTALDLKATISSVNTVSGAAATAQSDINDFKGQKGQPSGLASLDSGGKVPSSQLPAYVDDVLEFESTAGLPTTGETGKIYVTLDTNFAYRWSGSTYIRIVASPGSTDALPEGSTNLYFSNARAVSALSSSLALKAPLASPTFTGTVAGVTKSMVGLGSVDNTSDSAKPISAAAQAALDLKAPLASPTFTGTVGGVTKAHVGLGSVDNTSDSAKPVSTATQTALNAKAPLASPTFTGTVGGVTKAMVGLGSVDNTADTAKPVSTAQAAAIAAVNSFLYGVRPVIEWTGSAWNKSRSAAIPSGYAGNVDYKASVVGSTPPPDAISGDHWYEVV